MNFLFEGIHRLFGRSKENHGTHSGKEDSEVWKILTQTIYLILLSWVADYTVLNFGKKFQSVLIIYNFVCKWNYSTKLACQH